MIGDRWFWMIGRCKREGLCPSSEGVWDQDQRAFEDRFKRG